MKPVILRKNSTSAYLDLLDLMGRPGAVIPIKEIPMTKTFHWVASWFTGVDHYQEPDPENCAVLGGKWGCEWRVGGKTAFYFCDLNDAIFFKLRWGGSI